MISRTARLGDYSTTRENLSPNIAPDIYLLTKLEVAYRTRILLNRITPPNFLYSPLYPSLPTKLGTLPYNLR